MNTNGARTPRKRKSRWTEPSDPKTARDAIEEQLGSARQTASKVYDRTVEGASHALEKTRETVEQGYATALDTASGAYDKARERASRTYDRTLDTVGRTYSSARDTTVDMYGKTRDGASKALANTRDNASRAVDTTRQSARDAARQASTGIQNNPLSILFSGIAFGAVARRVVATQ